MTRILRCSSEFISMNNNEITEEQVERAMQNIGTVTDSPEAGDDDWFDHKSGAIHAVCNQLAALLFKTGLSCKKLNGAPKIEVNECTIIGRTVAQLSVQIDIRANDYDAISKLSGSDWYSMRTAPRDGSWFIASRHFYDAPSVRVRYLKNGEHGRFGWWTGEGDSMKRLDGLMVWRPV